MVDIPLRWRRHLGTIPRHHLDHKWQLLWSRKGLPNIQCHGLLQLSRRADHNVCQLDSYKLGLQNTKSGDSGPANRYNSCWLPHDYVQQEAEPAQNCLMLYNVKILLHCSGQEANCFENTRHSLSEPLAIRFKLGEESHDIHPWCVLKRAGSQAEKLV